MDILKSIWTLWTTTPNNEITFESMRHSVEGKAVLRRLFCGGYGQRADGSLRYGTEQAAEAFQKYIKTGSLEGKYVENYQEVLEIWKKLPANAKTSEYAAFQTTKGHLEHIRSNYNLRNEGIEQLHRKSDNIAGFGDPKWNTKIGSKDLTDKQVQAVKSRQRVKAYKAVSEEKGKQYADNVNRRAKAELTYKQFQIKLNNAIKVANKAGIYAFAIGSVIGAAWTAYSLYPNYVRGEISFNEYRNRIIKDGIITGLKAGAVAWILALITVLCPPLGFIISAVSTALFISNLPKLITELFVVFRNSTELLLMPAAIAGKETEVIKRARIKATKVREHEEFVRKLAKETTIWNLQSHSKSENIGHFDKLIDAQGIYAEELERRFEAGEVKLNFLERFIFELKSI